MSNTIKIIPPKDGNRYVRRSGAQRARLKAHARAVRVRRLEGLFKGLLKEVSTAPVLSLRPEIHEVLMLAGILRAPSSLLFSHDVEPEPAISMMSLGDLDMQFIDDWDIAALCRRMQRPPRTA